MPPIEHRWKPGQSGNPTGRPKGPSLTARIREILDNAPPGTGKQVAQALAEVAVREALKGDFRFFEHIMNRIDGPIATKIQADVTYREERLMVLLSQAGEAMRAEHAEALAEARRLSSRHASPDVQPPELPE